MFFFFSFGICWLVLLIFLLWERFKRRIQRSLARIPWVCEFELNSGFQIRLWIFKTCGVGPLDGLGLLNLMLFSLPTTLVWFGGDFWIHNERIRCCVTFHYGFKNYPLYKYIIILMDKVERSKYISWLFNKKTSLIM